MRLSIAYVELPLDLARTFDAVLTAGSLEAAARDLHLTPSAVSQRLKALETRLGRVLLVRSRPVRPTEAGRVVARLARQLVTLEQDALTELGLAENRAVTVPLAVNADSLATWFLPALAPLAPRGIAFDLYRDDQDFTAGLLESGTVTAAVTSQHRPVAGCTVRRLGAMRYLPAASPEFAARWFAAGADAVAFSHAPVVDFDRRDTLQTRYLESVGADPGSPPRHRVPASSDFAAAVRHGFGWGLVPEFQAAGALAGGQLVGLGGEPVEVGLYWQRWNLRSTLLETIEEAVVTAARGVLRP
ncbi:MAG: LysR family transcriptional regulator ArgP [Propionicimonas sp.]|nr:LysR family transcriptional regulator ArgP [Propionicimonas sp.]